MLGGRGELMNPEAAVPLAPGNVPAAGANAVAPITNNVNAPVNATINITQQPGEDGDALARRVTDQLKTQSKPVGFDYHQLLSNGGAK